MAQTMFGDVFSARQAGMDALEKSSLATAALGGEGAIIHAAGLGGGMLGRGIGQAFGAKTPEEAKMAKMQEIQAQFGHLDMALPENMRKVQDAFWQAGLYDQSREVADMIHVAETDISNRLTLLKSSAEEKGTMAQYMDAAAKMVKNPDGTVGCDWRNDAACGEQARIIAQEFKRSGVAEVGAKQRARGEAQLMTDAQEAIYADASMAEAQIATVNQSLALLDEGIFTGTAGEWVAGLQTALATFGIIEPDAAAGEEMFRVNSMMAIMNWVAQTKGAISEKEMALFVLAAPSLSKTEAGNRLMLNTMKRAAEFKRDEEREFNRYLQANPRASIIQWKAHRRNWVSEHGFTLPTSEEINAAKKGKTTIPTVSESSAPTKPKPKSNYTVRIVE